MNREKMQKSIISSSFSHFSNEKWSVRALVVIHQDGVSPKDDTFSHISEKKENVIYKSRPFRSYAAFVFHPSFSKFV